MSHSLDARAWIEATPHLDRGAKLYRETVRTPARAPRTARGRRRRQGRARG